MTFTSCEMGYMTQVVIRDFKVYFAAIQQFKLLKITLETDDTQNLGPFLVACNSGCALLLQVFNNIF